MRKNLMFLAGVCLWAENSFASLLQVTDLDEHFLPYVKFIPKAFPKTEPVVDQPPEKPDLTIPVQNTGGLRKIPSWEDLVQPNWQDVFYKRHHSGQQHFLIFSSDNDLLQSYLAVLMRLLVANPSCRITIVASNNEQGILSDQIRPLIRGQQKAQFNYMRDLHFIDNLFSSKSSEAKPIHNERYTGILLDRTVTDFEALKDKWLRTNLSMLYIPLDPDRQNPDAIKNQLYRIKFPTNYVVTTETMICAGTSDYSQFPKGDFRPAHNPTNIKTPVIDRKMIRTKHKCSDFEHHKCGDNCRAPE